MHRKHNIICCRVAGGINPSALVEAAVEYTDDWNADLVSVQISNVELVETQGNLAVLRDRLAELTPDGEPESVAGDVIQRVRLRKSNTTELVVDITNDPRFATMVAAEHYSILTGDRLADHETPPRIGRLILLSNLKTLLARKLLKFNPQDSWPDVQAALTSATAKPAPVETDGLLVTETSQNDDITLAVCLLCWRASEWPPGSEEDELDYSYQNAGVI